MLYETENRYFFIYFYVQGFLRKNFYLFILMKLKHICYKSVFLKMPLEHQHQNMTFMI